MNLCSMLVVVVLAVASFIAGTGAQVTPPAGCLKTDNHPNLWCPGAEGVAPANEMDSSYVCYKIPCLIRTTGGKGSGVVLAFIEARKLDCNDQGYVDLRLRRSLDEGKTWTQSQMVYSESNATNHVTIGDALPIWDSVANIVHLIFTRNNKDVYYTQSPDEGVTWAAPKNISAMVDGHRTKGNFICSGHGGGIQLHSGRLVAMMHGPCHMIYSDDHGKTWGKAPGGGPGGECQAAEIRPGLLIATGRNDNIGYTEIAYSTDDGMTWVNQTANDDLKSPVEGVEASIVAHPSGVLYHSGPDHFDLRYRMVVKKSLDNGKTWGNHYTPWTYSAGYSALAVLGDTKDAPLGLLYDRAVRPMIVFEAQSVSFVSFPAATTTSTNANTNTSAPSSEAAATVAQQQIGAVYV